MYGFTLSRTVCFKGSYKLDCIAHKLAALMIADRANAKQYEAIMALVRRYK